MRSAANQPTFQHFALRKLPWTVGLALVAMTWLAPGSAFAQSTSPGPLAKSHAKWDTPETCGKCHDAEQGPTDAKCLSCHDKTAKSKFHATQARDSSKRCAQCHREHRGRDFQMVRWTPPEKFPHEQTGFVLRDAHARKKCADCHKTPNRWTGLALTTCAKCHEDPHKPTLGGKCADCHTEVKFTKAERFSHDKAKYRLDGKHKDVACAKCHKAEGKAGVYRGLAFAKCSDCHKEPKENHSGGKDCATCHSVQGWTVVAAKAGADLHERTKLPLRGRHAEITCEKCHSTKEKVKGIERFAKVDRKCASCHREPHAGRFGQDCSACHGVSDWRMTSTSRFDHGKTRYALVGAHRTVACTACHTAGQPYRQRFFAHSGERCQECHGDPHGGPFASVQAGDKCETCHRIESFRPARYGMPDHDRSKYPLTGAHRTVACAECHQRPTPAPPKPPTPPKLQNLAQTCESCHRDPHGGQFVKRNPPLGCQDCHSTPGFTPSAFDHEKTRFPLAGPHAKVACAACHFRPQANAPVQFTGTRGRCEQCHRDPHGAQFTSRGPAKACDDCHGGGQTFKIAAFDHSKTRFPLDGTHAKAPCAKCHGQVKTSDGVTRAMYRIGPRNCANCHSNPHIDGSTLGLAHGAVAGVADWACATCHSTESWSSVPAKVAFDHRLTGVPLTGAHAQAPCSGCHRPRERNGPVPRACADCHADAHGGRMGPRCEDCHSALSWKQPRSLPKHENTRFPLTGAHLAADCRSCHPRGDVQQFSGTPTVCGDCHRDLGQAVRVPDHRLAGFGPGCQTCHTTWTWNPAKVDHGRWWALEGRHATAACASCHGGGVYRGLGRDCLNCHQANYLTSHPDHVAGGFPKTCGDCHTAIAWNVLVSRWHDRWFEVSTGSHSGLSCASCHPGQVKAGQFACTGCHEHNQSSMTGKHEGVGGFVWESHACYSCHPKG
ncbi:MAG: hypothetical protein ACOYOB_00955 [Myxococcota bacterium]